MTTNPLKPSINTFSQDSLSNYSRPFPFTDERQEFADVLQTLPLEENLQSWLIRLKEAQAKSFQSRMNMINELGKKELFFEKEAKEDDLAQFFTNNGVLRTLNEDIFEEKEEEKLEKIEKKDQKSEEFSHQKNHEIREKNEGKSNFFHQEFTQKLDELPKKHQFFPQEFPRKTEELPYKNEEFHRKSDFPPQKPEISQFFTDPHEEIGSEGKEK